MITSFVLAGGVVTCFLIFQKHKKQTQENQQASSPEGMQKFLQERGEAQMKKSYYGSQVAVYEKMLPIAPDNLDLKKKLASAYFGAGNFDKAKPLLEEIVQKDPSDQEAKKELEQINAKKY